MMAMAAALRRAIQRGVSAAARSLDEVEAALIMPKWRCPVCRGILPVRAVDPRGISCPHCRSDLRIEQPFHGMIGLSALVIPIAILALARAIALPWLLLVLVMWPFTFGFLLLLIRGVIALPLTLRTGPYGHFSMQDRKDASTSKDTDDSQRS